MRSPLLLGPALLAALTISILAPSARADIAPPPGYVEACTLEKQSGAGKQCFSCSAYHGNFNHCSESLASYGFAQSCRTRGASVWSEVWCRGASLDAKPVPKDVLAQLDNATSHPPAPTGPDVPPSVAPVSPLPPEPVATASAAPPVVPSAAPPAGDTPVAPPPLPPTGGCGGCAMPGPETAVAAPLLALGALAMAWSRRRNRR